MAQANKIARQTKSWLRKRPWFQKYIFNLRVFGHSDAAVEKFVTGKYNLGTLLDAFQWDQTPEGQKFWEQAQNEFMDWWGPCEEYENISEFI